MCQSKEKWQYGNFCQLFYITVIYLITEADGGDDAKHGSPKAHPRKKKDRTIYYVLNIKSLNRMSL